MRLVLAALCALCLLVLRVDGAKASIAYGTLNNFDCVNDTGVEAHGFDIELDDIHSKDITYTYDWNHYGVPKITEDSTDPLHPKVLVRYASAKKPDGTWAAYTAIPAGPIPPTQGHQFTDPTVNFGGERFGVGYYGLPTAVRYYWLTDDGTGKLVHRPPVNVSTPTFVYNPPAGGAPANVVAVIVPPPPPVLPPKQFGDAQWVKSIKTTTHNANKVHLNDLVGDDEGMPQPWANGEPAEVELEWRLMQTNFNAGPGGGKNGQLQGAAEDLPGGDEVITRRYEFYKYTGPSDAESGEAMADVVGADGLHGDGSRTYIKSFDPNTGEPVVVTEDMATYEVVGEFFGAQMSGFDVAPALGLIDNMQDGRINEPYPDRSAVVAGNAAFLSKVKSGSVPDGLNFDEVSGVLSGTPTLPGSYTFTVEASDTTGALVTKDYTLKIAGKVAFSLYAAKGTPGSTVTLRALVYNPTAPVSGLTIDFAVDGVPVGSGVSDGAGASCSYVIPADMTLGPHTVTVSFAGDTIYPASTRDASCLTVYVHRSAVGFSEYAVKGMRGQSVTLKALMISKGSPVLGRNVQFAVDGGVVGSAVSNAAGASLAYTVPSGMAPGTHNVTVSFAGDAYYYPAARTEAALTVVVPKVNVGFSLYAVSGSPSQVVTLRTLAYCGGVPASGLTVDFSVDGTPVGSAVSDATGASLSYTIPGGLAAGVHNVTVSFTGDAEHNAATRTTAALTVK